MNAQWLPVIRASDVRILASHGTSVNPGAPGLAHGRLRWLLPAEVRPKKAALEPVAATPMTSAWRRTSRS
jgi:hypothetical protein